MNHDDSVEVWGIYQDLHDVFEDQFFTVEQAREAANSSLEDLRVLLDAGLLQVNGERLKLDHGEKFKRLNEDLSNGELD